MSVIARGRSRTYSKSSIRKEKSITSITHTTTEDRATTTLQGPVNRHHGACSELCGAVQAPVEIHTSKYKAALLNQEPLADRPMLTSRSRFIVTETSETTCKYRKKKT